MPGFKLVREYLLSRLGVTNIVDGLAIIESEKRLRCEMNYSFIRLFWIIDFDNGDLVASVPVNTADDVKSFIRDNTNKLLITDELFISPLKELADRESKRLLNHFVISDIEPCRYFSDLVFACDEKTIAPSNPYITVERLVDTKFECCDDIGFPEQCSSDGIVYGVIENNKIVYPR